ncbi:MAG: hypothetical protein NT163_04600 [Chlorobiales bacterium]|jgi:hypothetical protein|nr:hypothetical protein [Chlorobiales bacterium]
MDVPNFTNNSLLMFHADIKQALFIDDNLPDAKTKVYEVRKNPDFRILADNLEKELDKRQVIYPKINWDF